SLSRVVTSGPLAHVLVEMVDSDGNVVATARTSAHGKFSLTAKKAGTYALRFSVLAGMYSTGSNSIDDGPMYAGQVVTLEPSNTTPIDLGDLVMPKTFMDNAAKTLQRLNNYNTSDFGGLQAYTFPLFQFDTTGAEAAL